MSFAKYLFKAEEEQMAAYRAQAELEGLKFAHWMRLHLDPHVTDKARIHALAGGGSSGAGTDGKAAPATQKPPPARARVEQIAQREVQSEPEVAQQPPDEDAKTRAMRIRAESLARSSQGRCTADTPRGSRCKLCKEIHK